MKSLSNNELFGILVIIGILFIIFILPILEVENFKEGFELKEKFDNIVKIDQNICSAQCCKFTQWPLPFNTQNPNIDDKSLENYIGSNLSCNNGQTGGGCVCFTPKDFNYLAKRGKHDVIPNDNNLSNI
jgi:hypothetical protein